MLEKEVIHFDVRIEIQYNSKKERKEMIAQARENVLSYLTLSLNKEKAEPTSARLMETL